VVLARTCRNFNIGAILFPPLSFKWLGRFHPEGLDRGNVEEGSPACGRTVCSLVTVFRRLWDGRTIRGLGRSEQHIPNAQEYPIETGH